MMQKVWKKVPFLGTFFKMMLESSVNQLPYPYTLNTRQNNILTENMSWTFWKIQVMTDTKCDHHFLSSPQMNVQTPSRFGRIQNPFTLCQSKRKHCRKDRSRWLTTNISRCNNLRQQSFCRDKFPWMYRKRVTSTTPAQVCNIFWLLVCSGSSDGENRRDMYFWPFNYLV